MNNLSLSFISWDWKQQPIPQTNSYLSWLKMQLADGHPVVWMVLCSGDPHNTYGQSEYDHIEPVFELYSQHPLSDTTVYPSDVLGHGSDWDQNVYYRAFDTLIDSPKKGDVLTGNCSKATPYGGGPNEAYPCLMDDINYGYAVTGLQMLPSEAARRVPCSLAVTGGGKEPENGSEELVATISVQGPLQPGALYFVYRWESTEAYPKNAPFSTSKYSQLLNFTATSSGGHTLQDPTPLNSQSSVYYVTVKA